MKIFNFSPLLVKHFHVVKMPLQKFLLTTFVMVLEIALKVTMKIQTYVKVISPLNFTDSLL